jgi:hypothetical protein
MVKFAMQNPTPFFPGFHLQTLRRKPRSASQMLADKLVQMKQNSFSQLGDCFSHFIPKYLLQLAGSGALSRQRFFSKENTFWAFFSQVLDADGGCKEVVRKLQALSAMKSKPLPSSSTAAYCQARQKLDLLSLTGILQHMAKRLQSMTDTGRLNGRRVSVIDGTGLSMPDTIENQQVWPQQRNQRPGCGFAPAFVYKQVHY